MIPFRFSFGCPMFDHIRNIANTNTPYKLHDPSARILYSIQQQWYDSSNITFMLHQQRLDMLILFTTLQSHNGLNLLQLSRIHKVIHYRHHWNLLHLFRFLIVYFVHLHQYRRHTEWSLTRWSLTHWNLIHWNLFLFHLGLFHPLLFHLESFPFHIRFKLVISTFLA